MRRPNRAARFTHPADPGRASSRHAVRRRAPILLQPARGYRVNVDTLIACRICRAVPPEGAARRRSRRRRRGALARRSARLGAARALRPGRAGPTRRLSRRAEPVAARTSPERAPRRPRARWAPAPLRGVADVVLANPPFFPRARRRTTASTRRASARSDRSGRFSRCRRSRMGRRAHAFFVYPAPALPEFLSSATAAGLVAKRLRLRPRLRGIPRRGSRSSSSAARSPAGSSSSRASIEWAARGVRSPSSGARERGRFPKRALRARRAGGRG